MQTTSNSDKLKTGSGINLEFYEEIMAEINPGKVRLVAVSKKQPPEKITELYSHGQIDFGENYAQELKTRYETLDSKIRWHFLGHLQTNKVKYIAPFVSFIQSVDSLRLLQEINKEAEKNHRIIECLFQVYIAQEESKTGFSFDEIEEIMQSNAVSFLSNIRICGLMGMATFTENQRQISQEFKSLRQFFETMKRSYFTGNESFHWLSMGMSDDYKIAVDEGSNMIRIGTKIFGNRYY